MEKKKKWIASGVALAAAAVLAVTGTFAWRSISQKAEIDTRLSFNPGGRLHDDADGQGNRDIYVENYTTEEDSGAALFVRVRLDEYMETGEDAGKDAGESGWRRAWSVVSGSQKDDKSTWATRTPKSTQSYGIATYWQWSQIGTTVYMPTFNMDRESKKADGMGTAENNFADYKAWTVGATLSDYETRTGGTKSESQVEHEAKETPTAPGLITNGSTYITMEKWAGLTNEKQKTGKYWVWDDDGWFYWAEPLQPGEATAVLLNGVKLTAAPYDRYYYDINAVCEIVTADDTGKGQGTGFYAEKARQPSENAQKLLQFIGAEPDIQVSAVDSAGSKTEYYTPGEAVSLSAKMYRKGQEEAGAIIWSVSGNTSSSTRIDASGKLTVGSDEQAGVLTVRATSAGSTGIAGVYKLGNGTTKTIRGITPGSTATVRIDGIEWYVLYKDADRALLLSKDILEKRVFSSSDTDYRTGARWSTSQIAAYLNGEWLDAHKAVQINAMLTTVKTGEQKESTELTETKNQVFLLSEADVYETYQHSGSNSTNPMNIDEFYTLGVYGKLPAPGGSWKATYNGTETLWWLRSLGTHDDYDSLAGDTSANRASYSSVYGVRPAFFYNLSGE